MESASSEFFMKQCGNYNELTNPNGFISGAQLRDNTIYHESADSPNSHYYQYKTAQDSSANLGSTAESQVGAPSESVSKFTMNVEKALNGKLADIGNATKVEPCEGTTNKDGADECTFNGPTNFLPYQPCN